ncbi:TPA: antirestriction protein ArdR [Klebsiella quasipneumoniae subsp. quasipneumoniae]|nr:antirestriction protein ArdR [Klebsiella quasipneumoniae subsp. quasipneumoniae]HCM7844840.1 antirestriction protein ArdR [Klebsiella quasipneumoniae subsp. quasipneumoniae]
MALRPQIARSWRLQNPEHADSGIVLIWNDAVYGWKNCLRDPQHERPGAIAIDSSEHIFIAEGGNEYDGAKCWVVLENKKELI